MYCGIKVMFTQTIFSALIFLITQSCWAMYPSSSSVIELTPSNFDKLVLRSDDIWIVEFFAPWCGHCQALVPEYTKAASALKVFLFQTPQI